MKTKSHKKILEILYNEMAEWYYRSLISDIEDEVNKALYYRSVAEEELKAACDEYNTVKNKQPKETKKKFPTIPKDQLKGKKPFFHG